VRKDGVGILMMLVLVGGMSAVPTMISRMLLYGSCTLPAVSLQNASFGVTLQPAQAEADFDDWTSSQTVVRNCCYVVHARNMSRKVWMTIER